MVCKSVGASQFNQGRVRRSRHAHKEVVAHRYFSYYRILFNYLRS